MFAVVFNGRVLFRAASARRCRIWLARHRGRFSHAHIAWMEKK